MFLGCPRAVGGAVATCSPETAPPGMRVDSARMPAGRPRDEAQAIHRGADHRDPEGGRGRSEEHRPLPAPRDQRETFYRWKAKYTGLEVNEARRLRTLEHENSRLKRLVADLTLDNQALKALVEKRSDARGAADRGAGDPDEVQAE